MWKYLLKDETINIRHIDVVKVRFKITIGWSNQISLKGNKNVKEIQ